jgi:hypothetical protein
MAGANVERLSDAWSEPSATDWALAPVSQFQFL